MYVAKFDKHGILWSVTLFNKVWSNEMLSHEIETITTKRFILHSSGYRWMNKEIAKQLFKQHKLEIIDG
jgi:hypothetical protein